MRVLVDVSRVADEPVGTGVYVVNLTAALAAGRQVDLHLLARNGDARRWRSLAQGARVHDRVPLGGLALRAWNWFGRRRFVRRLGADVWHGPDTALPEDVETHTVVTVHDLTVIEQPDVHDAATLSERRRALRSAVRTADVVVAVSNDTAARIHENLHPRAPVMVAPHGVDTARFRPAGDDRMRESDLERLRTLGVEPPFVAFVGTMEPRKNLPGLIEAFARIAPEHPDLKLVLAGRRGWRADEVSDAVRRAGLGDRIVLLGFAPPDALPALYRSAEVVVHPSVGEGFGLPALEALACAAPLVTTAGSAMEEVAGDAAVLVPSPDPKPLADAVERVLTERKLRDRLREAGPRAAGRYSWGRCARAHLDAYELAARPVRREPAP